MTNTSQFNASASMLGYIYQIRYGLLLSFRKLLETADPDSVNMSIEKLDDIAFDEDGTPEELLQTKFHGTPGNLTDRSPDIWKTVRVWVESEKAGEIVFGNVILSLVTTQSLPVDSLAEYLSLGTKRNVGKAEKLMSEICKEEGNNTNGKGYEAFKELSAAKQNALLNSIYVIGKSGDLLTIRDQMAPIARQSVPNDVITAFLDTIEGVWFGWSVKALSQKPTGVINLGNLQDLIDQLRPQYSLTNLPPEYSEKLPEVIDIEGDSRTFVQQLRLFKAPSSMIELGIINYYRAFEQRNKWSADGLLNPGELNEFDRKLFEKWQEQQAYLEAISNLETEIEKKKYSVELYHFCQQQGVVPIRPDFMEQYLSKGSYNILSDELKIGWHPEFKSLGEASNERAA